MDNHLPGQIPGQPVQTSIPPPTNSGIKNPWIKKVFIIITIIITLLGLVVTVYLVQQRQIFKPKAAEIPSWIAKVDNEEISQSEVSQVAQLLAHFEGKEVPDSAINQEALNFCINRRLLKKEADSQKLTSAAEIVADQRLVRSVIQYGNEAAIVQAMGTDITTYKNYLLDQAIREALQSNASQWVLVDYLSIRYLWHNNPEEEETKFQKIAENKINDYYSKIQNGLDIKEAIKQRCQDSNIDPLPFGNHLKMYSTTFDQTICREQRVNYKIGLDANIEWGEDWLKQVDQIPVGSTSGVIKYEKSAVGLYFIIKVLDKGGKTTSLADLITKLKTNSIIIIK